MERQYLYARVIREYRELQNKKRKRGYLILRRFTYVSIVTLVTTYLIYTLTGILFVKVLIPSMLGVFSTVLLIAFLLVKTSKFNKLIYTFLIDEIIKNMNLDNNTFLKYDPLIKRDKELNKLGGLFSRGAAVDLKFRISGNMKSIDFSIQEARIYTSDGKNQYQLFKGIYLFIGIKEPKSLQVRSKGKPHLKGKKLLLESDNPKVYAEEFGVIKNKYLNLFNTLSLDLDSKKQFLSSNDSGLHICIEVPFIKPPKTMSEDEFYNIYDYIEKLIKITNKYCQLISGSS